MVGGFTILMVILQEKASGLIILILELLMGRFLYQEIYMTIMIFKLLHYINVKKIMVIMVTQ